MFHRILLIFCLIAAVPAWCAGQLPPIGQWREHLSYHQAIELALEPQSTGPLVWCATPFSVFSVDLTDNSLERWSKVNGLSETGVAAIGYDAATRQLVVTYTNSNLDLLQQGKIKNIPAIKNSAVPGDKTIHQVFTRDGLAYLAAGLGIIVVDLRQQSVRDTWIIGNNGDRSAVYALAENNNILYAATADGLKRAPLDGSNLADFRHWQLLSGTDGLPEGPVQQTGIFQGHPVALTGSSLYIRGSNEQWQLLYSDSWQCRQLSFSSDRILLSQSKGNAGRVLVLTPEGILERTIEDPAYISRPLQVLPIGSDYWIADSSRGLCRFDGSYYEAIAPNSPQNITTGVMQVAGQSLWVAAGGVTDDWEPAGNQSGLYLFTQDSWTSFNAGNGQLPDSLPDLLALTADPVDGSLWAGSFGGGLLHRDQQGNYRVLKQGSIVQPASADPGSYRIAGLCTDADKNLWATNYGAPAALLVRKPDGSWHAFTIPFSIPDNGVAQVLSDDYRQVWIVLPKGNGLVCFNYGQSIDNPADDQWKWYREGAGNGNLPANEVLSLAKDKNGFIWVGTSRGIAIIQCPGQAFTNTGCEALLPVVQQDNFAGYLFRDQQVQCLAVDGANRKWVGTRNGLWLISPDGNSTIYRFAENNSPLPGNDIQQLAIDGITGEVYIATSKGICSFRSTATEGGRTHQQVLVFPNPVPPDYAGTIAIRGLAENAIVKITEPGGRLVYQTRALGGQAIWNGRHYNGSKVATGVYLVLISDAGKQEQKAAKIVFIKP
ncbi:MAG: two-component regulator propeller domain-containing protein [Candidatus Pseudobacter hemicellulosilyticus]|uniref:Two-component regulator propeller domain-containing protein n=1 Tax=Candidatus Pseudobacter hemicellulosilyticus TaxID=3121375 RepID=A0AAJ5WXA8_9BACT|nr:MAG: two-component regulator propeller domain-containing protein [Pseudobacter sp.]